MSTIKSSTTNTTAYQVVADTTGALVIQTGVTPTTALTIGSDQSVTMAGTLAVTGKVTNASMPIGSVVQVVQASTSSNFDSTSTTYADSNLTASITPTSATSKILVLVNQHIFATGGAAVGYGFQTNAGVKLVRGATDLVTPSNDSGGKGSIFLSTGVAPASGIIVIAGYVSFTYLDSPATTSSTTYKTQVALGTSGMSHAYANSSNPSFITLMEIAA
jgi:hypothetical protein